MVHMLVVQIYWMLVRELFDNNITDPMLARKVQHERKKCPRICLCSQNKEVYQMKYFISQ